VDPHVLREYVRGKKRVTGKSNKSSHGHYSWDWHDVHFVPLNLFPGDSPIPIPDQTVDSETADLSPFYRLSYLNADLASTVGNSRRPVILIHHYGFDPFSLGWWTEEQRLHYWNAIKDYNVIAILTGHVHNDTTDTRTYFRFEQPAGAGGPAFFPTFVVGAVRSNDNPNGLGA